MSWIVRGIGEPTGERGLFKKVEGEFVPWDGKAKAPVAHGVITDEMEPIKSMATFEAKTFTSKSAYKRHLKEHGFVETGGAHLRDIPDSRKYEEEYEAGAREDALAAYYDVKYGRVEFTEAEKELHKREQRELERNGLWKMKPPK